MYVQNVYIWSYFLHNKRINKMIASVMSYLRVSQKALRQWHSRLTLPESDFSHQLWLHVYYWLLLVFLCILCTLCDALCFCYTCGWHYGLEQFPLESDNDHILKKNKKNTTHIQYVDPLINLVAVATWLLNQAFVVTQIKTRLESQWQNLNESSPCKNIKAS